MTSTFRIGIEAGQANPANARQAQPLSLQELRLQSGKSIQSRWSFPWNVGGASCGCLGSKNCRQDCSQRRSVARTGAHCSSLIQGVSRRMAVNRLPHVKKVMFGYGRGFSISQGTALRALQAAYSSRLVSVAQFQTNRHVPAVRCKIGELPRVGLMPGSLWFCAP